jgi:hypothetical protein
MRATLILLVVLLSGCKTAELAITHPTTGIHVVARIEADASPGRTELVPFASSQIETVGSSK